MSTCNAILVPSGTRIIGIGRSHVKSPSPLPTAFQLISNHYGPIFDPNAESIARTCGCTDTRRSMSPDQLPRYYVRRSCSPADRRSASVERCSSPQTKLYHDKTQCQICQSKSSALESTSKSKSLQVQELRSKQCLKDSSSEAVKLTNAKNLEPANEPVVTKTTVVKHCGCRNEKNLTKLFDSNNKAIMAAKTMEKKSEKETPKRCEICKSDTCAYRTYPKILQKTQKNEETPIVNRSLSPIPKRTTTERFVSTVSRPTSIDPCGCTKDVACNAFYHERRSLSPVVSRKSAMQKHDRCEKLKSDLCTYKATLKSDVKIKEESKKNSTTERSASLANQYSTADRYVPVFRTTSISSTSTAKSAEQQSTTNEVSESNWKHSTSPSPTPSTPSESSSNKSSRCRICKSDICIYKSNLTIKNKQFENKKSSTASTNVAKTADYSAQFTSSSNGCKKASSPGRSTSSEIKRASLPGGISTRSSSADRRHDEHSGCKFCKFAARLPRCLSPNRSSNADSKRYVNSLSWNCRRRPTSISPTPRTTTPQSHCSTKTVPSLWNRQVPEPRSSPVAAKRITQTNFAKTIEGSQHRKTCFLYSTAS